MLPLYHLGLGSLWPVALIFDQLWLSVMVSCLLQREAFFMKEESYTHLLG